LEAAPDIACSVLGKEELLARALQSLIETAAKFCPVGATIRLSHRVTPIEAWLEIAADGGRIPLKVLDRFFEVFSIGESIAPWGDLGLGPPVAERPGKLGVGDSTRQVPHKLFERAYALGCHLVERERLDKFGRPGEPLLRRDCFEILEYARQLGFSVKLKTNAVMIGAAQAARPR